MSFRIDSIPASSPWHPPRLVIDPTPRGGLYDSCRADAGRKDEPCVDAFRAGPGAVPYADYLRAQNIRHGLAEPTGLRIPLLDLVPEQASPCPEPRSEPGPVPPHGPDRNGASADGTLARLGDVPPIEPPRPDMTERVREVYTRPAGSGRMIDVVI